MLILKLSLILENYINGGGGGGTRDELQTYLSLKLDIIICRVYEIC